MATGKPKNTQTTTAKKEAAKKTASKAKKEMTGQPSMETDDENIHQTSEENAANVADVVQNKQATE